MEEITVNKTKCDFIFKSHLFAHNIPGVPDPACACGYRSQTTMHLLLNCPLFDRMRQEFIDGLGSLPDFNLEAYDRLNAKTKLEVLLYGSGISQK
jgi:hypothetical protein